MTEEIITAAITEIMRQKREKGIGPADQVTLLEMMNQFPDQHAEVRKGLNALFKNKKIKVGPTMNGTYIKFRS